MRNIDRRLAVTLVAKALTGALIWASTPVEARNIHGGIANGGTPPSGQIATLTLTNTGASETPMWSKMFGHFFDDNDVTGCPLSGGLPTYPIFKIGGTTYQYTMSTPRYYPSGRICHAMFSLLLNVTIGAGASTTVTVNQGASTVPAASSRTLSDLTAADLKSIVTFMDNGSGTYTSSLNDGISSAYSDNITWADGAAGKVVRVRATYKNAGTPEGNMEGYFYVFIRQDASGNYGGCEVMGCLATPWGDATAAKRQWKSFSAMTWQTGSTVIRDNVASGRSNTGTFTWAGSGDAISVNTPSASYETWCAVRFTTTGTLPAGLSLNTTYYLYTGSYYTPPYTKFSVYSAPGDSSSNYVIMSSSGTGVHTYTVYPWVTCYGRLFLCGTTGEYDYVQGGGSVAPVSGTVMTNVQVKQDMVYMSSSMGIPPYDRTAPVTSGTATPFYINTNCGLTNTPDAGGIDEHIGILPTPMARYIYTQSLTDERNVRAIGLAGGQIGSCLRLSTTGRIPTWNNGHGGTGTPYSGMGSLNPTGRYGGTPGTTFTFAPFDNASYNNMTCQMSGDASHRTAYNWLPYALTGQLEYLDMLIETANCAPASGYNGGSGPAVSRISTSAYGPHGTAASDGSAEGSRIVTAPDGITRYCIFTITDSKRQDAWQFRDCGICAGLIPQSFAEWQYFQDLIDDNLDFMTAIAANPPSSYAGTNGLFYNQGSVYIDPQWQTAYMLMALAMEYGMRKNSKSVALMTKLNTWLAHVMNTYGLYAIDSEEYLERTGGNSNASPLISNDNQLAFYGGGQITAWSNGSANFTYSSPDLVPSVGDGIFFTTPSPPSQQTTPVPAAFTAFQRYFVVSKTGTGPYTLQLSATSGGSAIVNTDSFSGGITIWIQPASPLNTLFANNVTDYPTVIYRAMLMAKSRGATVDSTAQAAMAAACPAANISAFGATPTYCFKGAA